MAAHTDHPSFPQPADAGLRVWRYLDFAKLVAMLESQSLHFARVDTLRDPFEGTLSRLEFEQWRATAHEAAARHPNPTPDFERAVLDAMLDGTRRLRREMYVNCWHLAQGESEAMWRLYATSGYAIAIESEYRRLVDVLPQVRWEESFVGLVKYVDHDADAIPAGNGFNPVMHKRRAFEHEREVRAVIWRTPLTVPIEADDERWPLGIDVPVRLSELVTRLVVSPQAPVWFADVVQAVVRRYALAVPVDRSGLLAAPYI